MTPLTAVFTSSAAVTAIVFLLTAALAALHAAHRLGFFCAMLIDSMRVLRRCACVFAIAWLGSGVGLAASPSPTDESMISLEIKDLTPKFLEFYQAAQKEQASPDRRWELWKQMYDFAAVPPTDEGHKIARRMLDEAWPRYASVLELIGGGAATLTPDPQAMVQSIAELLKVENPAKVTLRVFVGSFDNNAFTVRGKSGVTTNLPIEMDAEPRARIMAHELTHAVHIAMGTFSGGWIRSIGATVVSEGLAMRVSQKLFPNDPPEKVAEHTAGWLKEADAKRTEILKSIQPALGSDKSEDVMRFTMGQGPNGLEREAYYVGWAVVGHWLENGMTLADVARIPETEMPQRVAETLTKLVSAR